MQGRWRFGQPWRSRPVSISNDAPVDTPLDSPLMYRDATCQKTRICPCVGISPRVTQVRLCMCVHACVRTSWAQRATTPAVVRCVLSDCLGRVSKGDDFLNSEVIFKTSRIYERRRPRLVPTKMALHVGSLEDSLLFLRSGSHRPFKPGWISVSLANRYYSDIT